MEQMLKFIVGAFLLFFYFTSYAGYSPLNKIKISSIKGLPVMEQYRELVLKAYAAIGYSVEFMEMPSAREIIEINKGTVDALVVRLSVIEKGNPDLIRVPVILATGELFLYCQIDVPCNHSVVDEPSNVIGAVFGQNYSSIYLEKSAASVYKTATANQLAEMLSKKRLNYILTFEVNGFGNVIGLDKSKYNVVKLDSFRAFHYIHRRIENILPELTLSLKNTVKSCSENHQCTF